MKRTTIEGMNYTITAMECEIVAERLYYVLIKGFDARTLIDKPSDLIVDKLVDEVTIPMFRLVKGLPKEHAIAILKSTLVGICHMDDTFKVAKDISFLHESGNKFIPMRAYFNIKPLTDNKFEVDYETQNDLIIKFENKDKNMDKIVIPNFIEMIYTTDMLVRYVYIINGLLEHRAKQPAVIDDYTVNVFGYMLMQCKVFRSMKINSKTVVSIIKEIGSYGFYVKLDDVMISDSVCGFIKAFIRKDFVFSNSSFNVRLDKSIYSRVKDSIIKSIRFAEKRIGGIRQW